MSSFEIISTVLVIITLLGSLMAFLHGLEKDQAERKAFEGKIMAILDKLEAQNNELLRQVEASKEDRRTLDKRIGIVEESIKLSHSRIDDLSIKLDKLREKIK